MNGATLLECRQAETPCLFQRSRLCAGPWAGRYWMDRQAGPLLAFAAVAIVIKTVQDHLERGYTLSCWCPRCRVFVGCSFERLVAKGKADKPLAQVRIRHRCGSEVEIRRIPAYGRR